ncbi:unnamed protein product [Lactuca virosa]|uniref:Uncharacterized protein n=1 Tax=Lactuca virosa TaxID=75947 RepID=A0AAU9N1L0_9ASTR|nr:unnamed protein product [Lactuca virosa]
MAPTSSLVAIQRSSWQSQVPYLFAGLAAMFGLIAIAVFILVCSFWNLSHYTDNTDGERDLETGNGDEGSTIDNYNKEPPVVEEKYLVIMAGLAKPTFLAIPTLSRPTSIGTCSSLNNSTSLSMEKASTSMVEMAEKQNQGSSNQQQVRNTYNNESEDQAP